MHEALSGEQEGDQQETGNQQIWEIISGIAIEKDHMYNAAPARAVGDSLSWKARVKVHPKC